MTYQRVYELMDIEHECVLRNHYQECDRNCKDCDLVQKDVDLIEAYVMAKNAIKNMIKEGKDYE